MQIREIINHLEQWAPPSFQESYDNSGLIAGNAKLACTGVLVSLDCTESVVLEAEERGCNLIVSHHPLLFSPIKSLTGKNETERALIGAIERKIAVYAIHTNLDHVQNGVNAEISRRLGLQNSRILRPLNNKLLKLITYVPDDHLEKVRQALFEAGAGHIGAYDQCSYASDGIGTFRPLEGTKPFSGKINTLQQDPEKRLELLLPSHRRRAVLEALENAHPYAEVAFDLLQLENTLKTAGSGMIGSLPVPMPASEFLKLVKDTFGGMVRYTEPPQSTVQHIALCGGSGSFLLEDAKNQNADVFLSSDFKYHQFFDADGKLMLVDIGHYEAEQYTSDLIVGYLNEKISNFAVLLTRQSTNPVRYL